MPISTLCTSPRAHISAYRIWPVPYTRSPPPFGRVSRAPGAAKTPKMSDFRSLQKLRLSETVCVCVYKYVVEIHMLMQYVNEKCAYIAQITVETLVGLPLVSS